MKNKYSIVLLFIPIVVSLSAIIAPEFSYKTHGNIANYFENEEQFKTFFDFKENQYVAEIGAGNGNNMVGFNQIAKNVTFYVQDIDAKTLSEKRVYKLQSELSKIANGNTFHRSIGTYTQSNLPDNTFDKIFLISTFHEFSEMDEMMADIHQKLKKGGKLYILESHCATATHKNYSAEETQTIVAKQTFRLIKKETGDINGSKGLYRLVFEKV